MYMDGRRWMDFPTPDSDVDSIEPESLKARIDDGESVTLLDARMSSDYEEWRIDGPNVESINVPYFQFLDEEIDDLPPASPTTNTSHSALCEGRRQRVRRGRARRPRLRRRSPGRRDERLGIDLRDS